jgi:hypothetical protein
MDSYNGRPIESIVAIAISLPRDPRPDSSALDHAPLAADTDTKNQRVNENSLRALRAIKIEEKTESGFLNSMIGSLAAKTMGVAEVLFHRRISRTSVLYPFPCDLLTTSNQRHVNRTRRVSEFNDWIPRRKNNGCCRGDWVQC